MKVLLKRHIREDTVAINGGLKDEKVVICANCSPYIISRMWRKKEALPEPEVPQIPEVEILTPKEVALNETIELAAHVEQGGKMSMML